MLKNSSRIGVAQGFSPAINALEWWASAPEVRYSQPENYLRNQF